MSMRGPDRATSCANAPHSVPRGNRVYAEMAQSGELAGLVARDEAAEPAAGDVLEEHPLDGIPRAEAEDLIALRLDELLGHDSKTLGENSA